MAAPLPKVNSPQVQLIADEDPNYLSAYTICLKYEGELSAFKNKLRYVRILGFLLLHALNRGVRSEVTKCIHSCEDSSDLTDVGAFFERSVIIPFKKYKGRTSNPSEHSSRSSFEVTKDKVKVNITEAPRNHQDAKHHALIRDDWRCVVVTGTIDRGAPKDIIAKLDPRTTVGGNTRCAHIIPETSTLFGKSKDNSELDYAASGISAVLKRFRHDINTFNGGKVHSLINVISMEKNVHDAFDRLELYFEATSQTDRYEVKWFGLRHHPNLRQFVTFSTSDPEHLPVPAPELLALHATCCKVAQLSGAAEYIDEIYRDADNISVLSG